MTHLSEDAISKHIAGERNPETESHLAACSRCAGETERTLAAIRMFRAASWDTRPKPRLSTLRYALAGALTAAALVALAVFVPRPATPRNQVFVEIPYVVPAAPYERTSVVRMNVPVAALIAAGFRIRSQAEDYVPADVLTGQDGRALAVSIYPDSNPDSKGTAQ
jgi:hypothetical protein